MEPGFDVLALPTPCYVVDEGRLTHNLRILRQVADRTGCRILLAQKAFAMYSLYPLIGRYLDGTAASGLFEARLGREEMGGETHVFSAAYREDEFDEILALCDHIVFNSLSQWERFRGKCLGTDKKFGIRVNPECSTQERAVYDPCAPGSRLGVTAASLYPEQLEGLSGLHFHTLCEQNSDALVRTVTVVEERFAPVLRRMDWVNFGGGHHITRDDYDVDTLADCVIRFKEKYGVEVYLEPGEAVALNAGFLVATVLDVVDNGIPIAILDASAACHMPDVLEMPYRPPVVDAGLPGVKAHTFRLAGPTCLAGDVIGDYSFDTPLKAGDRVVFEDMAIYTMVKNNTFNGINLPSIAVADGEGRLRIIRRFEYGDFKGRLS